MRLKKLQLSGFKTFADKTVIEFGEGLTAVVGPNGCGKSNVADALLWVLGEQNPRLLRGSDSRDVVFNGTDRRKPLGMAEVRLTIDNTDHTLPVEFAEVTISRRVYRSGESQYHINQSPCRLKDIVDLFLDTGLGRDAYSFVSQNEIDAVLSARAEDRRELFEEAAGIKKYRVRKREAVRKLENAEANLTRIRDIVAELEQQRAPLEAQAETARRFLDKTERLRQIEVDLLVVDLKKADYELYASRTEKDLDADAIATFDANLAQMERESDAAKSRLAEAEEQLESARLSRQSAHSTVERTESQLQLIEERGSASEKTADTLDQELRELLTRATALTAETEQAASQLAATETEAEKAAGELAMARAALKELETSLADVLRRAEDRQGALRRLAEQRAQREASLAACRGKLGEVRSRIDRLQEESEAAVAELNQIGERVASGKERVAKAVAEAAELEQRRSEMEASRRATQDEHSQASVALDATRRKMAERQARLATLTEMQQSGEGFYQGVRSVLTAVRQRQLAGSYAPVVDLLTVPEDLRIAVEVALGSNAQDIVCDTEAEAKSAIRWLKENRAGRATFLALPLLRPGSPLSAHAVSQSGIVGVAARLVTAEERYGPVVDLLLGRCVIARDMDAAIRASQSLEGWNRIVTLEGEVLSPGGALTGGSLQGRGAHLVGRKGEIDDLKRELPGLQEEGERCTREVSRLAAAIEASEAALGELGRQIATSRGSVAAAESDLKASERDAERGAAKVTDLRAELDRRTDARTKLEKEESEWQQALDAALAEDATVDDAIAMAQQEAQALTERRDEARANAQRLEVEAGRLAEKRNGLRAALASTRHSLEQTISSQRTKQGQRELAATQWKDADTKRAELLDRLDEARKNRTACDEQYEQWHSRRQELLNESFEKTSAIKETTAQRARTVQEMHDAELQIARLEVRLSQTAQRLQDEYGMSQEEALALPDPETVDRDTVNEITRLRRELRQMGQVNTGAVEEFERLTERHEFLSGQQRDLDSARKSLLETIQEIDDSTRGIFMETFDAVAVAFSDIYQRLFGGGSTRLVLTDPEDLLNTGIDVFAQPPGKKPQHLSLLSGGERALTAVALLFAFLTVHPSPFAVLDEVDAPLDGANVERFVELVKDYGKHTQMLVITHNPTTMEAAPRWYGITMQEPGVSRALAYKVPEEAMTSRNEEVILPVSAEDVAVPQV